MPEERTAPSWPRTCSRTVISRCRSFVGQIQERCLGIADVEDQDPKRLGLAAVVSRHFYVWRFDQGLTCLDRHRFTAFELERKCSFQYIDRDRKSMRMKDGLVAWLEARGEHAHLLRFAARHASNHFSQHEIRLCGALLLSHEWNTEGGDGGHHGPHQKWLSHR